MWNNNPIVVNTVKAWFAVRKLEGRSLLTPLLSPVQGNPDFEPGMTDTGYIWTRQGIKKMCDLFVGSSLSSFEQIQAKYNLPGSHFF